MANATIDNTPVSIQLTDTQSTTVPTNETWKVTISLFSRSSQFDRPKIVLNGTNVLGIAGDINDAAVSTPSASFVLVGGDNIEVKAGRSDGTAGAAIQGFVVNS